MNPELQDIRDDNNGFSATLHAADREKVFGRGSDD